MILHLKSGEKWKFEWRDSYQRFYLYIDGPLTYELRFVMEPGMAECRIFRWATETEHYRDVTAEIGAERLVLDNCEVIFK